MSKITSSSSAKLDYAPPARWRESRWLRRAVIAILIVSALTLLVSWGWKFSWSVQRAHLQKQCLDFAMGPDQVVYTEDRNEANSLLRTDSRYLRTSTGAAYEPEPAARFFTQERPSGFAFMHARHVDQQPDRLVCVRVWIWHTSSTTRTVWLESTAMRAVQLNVPRQASELLAPGQSLPLTVGGDDALRLFAGQPDPGDASHFTISYDLNGQKGMIDGWLKTGDSVVLEVRDGPLKK